MEVWRRGRWMDRNEAVIRRVAAAGDDGIFSW